MQYHAHYSLVLKGLGNDSGLGDRVETTQEDVVLVVEHVYQGLPDQVDSFRDVVVVSQTGAVGFRHDQYTVVEVRYNVAVIESRSESEFQPAQYPPSRLAQDLNAK